MLPKLPVPRSRRKIRQAGRVFGKNATAKKEDLILRNQIIGKRLARARELKESLLPSWQQVTLNPRKLRKEREQL